MSLFSTLSLCAGNSLESSLQFSILSSLPFLFINALSFQCVSFSLIELCFLMPFFYSQALYQSMSVCLCLGAMRYFPFNKFLLLCWFIPLNFKWNKFKIKKKKQTKCYSLNLLFLNVIIHHCRTHLKSPSLFLHWFIDSFINWLMNIIYLLHYWLTFVRFLIFSIYFL